MEKINQEVYTDSKWCQFIFNQIIQNSIKYRKEKDAQIIFSAQKEKECIVFSIQDNGIGIKESEIERIWDKGFTGSNGRTGKKSTGLGLYLSKKLCNKLGIGIELTSKEKEGTKVTFTFPVNSYFIF